MNNFFVLRCPIGIFILLLADTVFIGRLTSHALESEGILGGHVAPIGLHTFHVFIDNSVGYCSGTIIDERHIVTVAHCTVNEQLKPMNPLKIIGGVNNLYFYGKYRVEVNVRKIYLPLKFMSTWPGISSWDIAVLRLEHPLGIDSNIFLSKVILPPRATAGHKLTNFANKKAIVTGFGWDQVTLENLPNNKSNITGSSTGQMRYALTKISNNMSCQRLYGFFTQMMICAQIVPRNPPIVVGLCRGDSGAPLVYKRNILIGVNSVGPTNCDESNRHSIYTNISSHLNFIRQARADVCSESGSSEVFCKVLM